MRRDGRREKREIRRRERRKKRRKRCFVREIERNGTPEAHYCTNEE
jgi:hypothetical protein